jgi:shikimate dehydrogenase
MLCLDTNKKNIKKILGFLSKDKKFIGGCIAVPHKEVVYKELLKTNSLDKITKKIGAVNCIYKNKKKIFGTNTDGEAALKVFNKKFGNLRDKKFLILGYGGVGKAISAFFSYHFKSKIMVSNRTIINKKIIKKNNIVFTKWKYFHKILPIVDVIVNCTSLGFNKNTGSPISKNRFNQIKKNTYFFDVIYNPLETTFLKLSKLKSKNSLNGLEMNKMQAILAIKKVLDRKISLKMIEKNLSNF